MRRDFLSLEGALIRGGTLIRENTVVAARYTQYHFFEHPVTCYGMHRCKRMHSFFASMTIPPNSSGSIIHHSIMLIRTCVDLLMFTYKTYCLIANIEILCFDRLKKNHDWYFISISIVKSFKKSSNLDQAELNSWSHFQMASVWSESIMFWSN